MAFRFRKSFKIAPGVRINIGKNGISSMGFGPRGASMSVGKQGIYSNVGIPGTGFSFRSKVGGDADKRRTEREERRAQKAQKRLKELERRREELSKVTLSLAENGSINVMNSYGELLSRGDIKLMWEQQSEAIAQWLQNEADEINGDIDLLENIYLDTPDPDSVSEYYIRDFDIPKPAIPRFENRPVKEEFPDLGFFARLLRSKREAHQNQIDETKSKYEKDLRRWNEKRLKVIKEYEKTLKKWEIEKNEFIKKEKYYKENFYVLLNEDTEFMEGSLSEVLNALPWPRETFISYEIDADGAIVWVDIDLPEIEDMPQKVASIAANGRKLNIKNKAKKQLRMEYAKHIHGIAFRLVGTIFAILPKAQRIIVSGYSQRLDETIGKVNDDYLYSFKIDRENFTNIDFASLEKVDPILALDIFEHRKKMTATGIFKPIEAFSKYINTGE
jgi:hypothetical protein